MKIGTKTHSNLTNNVELSGNATQHIEQILDHGGSQLDK